jgi:hypothetical protein
MIGIGLTEAESLALSGYVVETIGGRSDISGGQVIKTFGTGTASGVFTGDPGNYFFDVGWFNEHDGVSQFALQVDGETRGSWSGTGGSPAGTPTTQRIALTLQGGEQITLVGTKQGGEYARIDTLTVSVDGGSGTPPSQPSQPSQPSPGLPEIGLGLTEAESLALSGYAVETISGRSDISGGQVIKTFGTGTASGVFTGAAGDYFLDVDWFNESDGVSQFALQVDGVTRGSWSGTGGSAAGTPTTQRIALSLEGGEEITLVGTKGGGEYARIDTLRVSVDDGSGTPLPADAFDFFAFAGQSNANGHFFRRSGDDTPGPLGHQVFDSEIQRLTGVDPTLINTSVSGSSSNEQAPSSAGYWWHLGNDAPGQLLLNAVATIRASIGSQKDLDGIIWAQGEHDAGRVASGSLPLADAVANLKAATTEIFDYFRTEFGDVLIFIQELGDFAPTTEMGAMRTAQQELIDQLDYVYMGAPTADEAYDHHDQIHFSVEGYGDIAEVLAQSVVDVIDQVYVA